MGVGSLATIAVQRPPNLAIVVQDNEHYGETGMQETHTGHGTDLVAIARGAGFEHALRITAPGEMAALVSAARSGPGPFFGLAKVAADPLPLVLPPREGAHLQARLREAILGPGAYHQL